MSQIEIREVTGKKELKTFIQFYYDLYRDCDQAVPFLYFDEMNTLRHDKNPSFECCEARYFIAYRDGKVVGRIAGIINHRANERWNRKAMRFGWFDFIDDKEVSKALLSTVENWGREVGMNEFVGPMGFTDMDREGMLVEGYDEMSTHYVNYNYPYYIEHIKNYGGFVKDNDYLEYHVKVPEKVPEKFSKVTEMVKKRYNLAVHKLTRDEIMNKNMGRKVFEIINATYKDLYGYSQLSDHQIDALVSDYIEKADLNLVTTIVDNNAGGKMVGFGITFPSFARAMKKTRDGRLFPFGWWHILKAIKWHKTDTVDLLLIGVLPEYRAKGANAIIFDDLIKYYIKYGFKWAEAMPQMETNEGVLSQWQYLEAYQHRRHRCYKKELR